jgi:hypothetical protein
MGAGLVIPETFVPNGQGNLIGQGLKKVHNHLPEVIPDVDPVHPVSDKIAGKEDAAGLHDELDDRFPGREGFRAYVIEAFLAIARKHKLVNNGRNFFPVSFCPQDID